MKIYLYIILPVAILLSSFSSRDGVTQRVVVVVKDRNAGTTYSESDYVVCAGEEIGKVDSVRLIEGDPVYFITIDDEFRIPAGSKVIISDRSLFDKQVEFITSAQLKYRDIDTFYIEPNPDDNKFKYTLKYENLNVATTEEKEKLAKDLEFLTKFDSLNINSYSKTGPTGDMKKVFNEINNFWKNDTINKK